MKAWHFLRADGCLRYTGERVVVGETLRVDPDNLHLCKYGLHSSRHAIDALFYAPGPIVCRVEIGGRIVHGKDKLVASERTVIAMVDATRVLHEFACRCAEDALSLAKHPDPRSVEAVRVKRLWLDKQATDEQLFAARDAARNAARDVEWDVEWDAAGCAAGYAARNAAGCAANAAAADAAWDVADVTARNASRGTTWSVTRAAMRDKQNKRLTSMLSRVLRDD